MHWRQAFSYRSVGPSGHIGDGPPQSHLHPQRNLLAEGNAVGDDAPKFFAFSCARTGDGTGCSRCSQPGACCARRGGISISVGVLRVMVCYHQPHLQAERRIDDSSSLALGSDKLAPGHLSVRTLWFPLCILRLCARWRRRMSTCSTSPLTTCAGSRGLRA